MRNMLFISCCRIKRRINIETASLVAQRGEYVGKLIVLSLDESERTIYDKIMKIVGESDICVDKTLLSESANYAFSRTSIKS